MVRKSLKDLAFLGHVWVASMFVTDVGDEMYCDQHHQIVMYVDRIDSKNRNRFWKSETPGKNIRVSSLFCTGKCVVMVLCMKMLTHTVTVKHRLDHSDKLQTIWAKKKPPEVIFCNKMHLHYRHWKPIKLKQELVLIFYKGIYGLTEASASGALIWWRRQF